MQTFISYEFQVHKENVVSTRRVLPGKSDFSFYVETQKTGKKLKVKREGK